MLRDKFLARIGMIGGSTAAGLLIAQIIIGVQVGSDLVGLQSLSPLEFNRLAAEHSNQVQLLMMLDDMFVVSYLMAFVGLASSVWDRRVLALLGLGSAIVLAFFDLLENSITLGLVGIFLAEQTLNRLPSVEVNHLLVLNVIGQMKWLSASIAIGSLGIAAWDVTKLNRVVSILFLIFVPFVAWGMINPWGATARVLWMLVLLISGAVVLLRLIQN